MQFLGPTKKLERTVKCEVDVVDELAPMGVEGDDLAAARHLSVGPAADESVRVFTDHGHGRVIDHGGSHGTDFFVNGRAGLGRSVWGWDHLGQAVTPFQVEGVVGHTGPYFVGGPMHDDGSLVADWLGHVLVFLTLVCLLIFCVFQAGHAKKAANAAAVTRK